MQGTIGRLTQVLRASSIVTTGVGRIFWPNDQRIRARFSQAPPELDLTTALRVRREGREMELIVNGSGPELLERIRQHNPEALSTEALTLEEIFVAALKS